MSLSVPLRPRRPHLSFIVTVSRQFAAPGHANGPWSKAPSTSIRTASCGSFGWKTGASARRLPCDESADACDLGDVTGEAASGAVAGVASGDVIGGRRDCGSFCVQRRSPLKQTQSSSGALMAEAWRRAVLLLRADLSRSGVPVPAPERGIGGSQAHTACPRLRPCATAHRCTVCRRRHHHLLTTSQQHHPPATAPPRPPPPAPLQQEPPVRHGRRHPERRPHRHLQRRVPNHLLQLLLAHRVALEVVLHEGVQHLRLRVGLGWVRRECCGVWRWGAEGVWEGEGGGGRRGNGAPPPASRRGGGRRRHRT